MKILLTLLLLVSSAKADWANFATPVSFTQNGNNVTLNISGSQVNQISNYQGISQSVNINSPWTISGTLNITTDYLTSDRAAFIQALHFTETSYISDGSDNPQYLTLGIRNGLWAVWDGTENDFDTVGTGVIGLHTFSISTVGTQYIYAVDGMTVASYDQPTSVTAPLYGIQLVSFNYGSDYVSQWSNVTPDPSLALGLLLFLGMRRFRRYHE